MKKILSITLVLLLLFSFNIMAQEAETLDVDLTEEDMESLDLSQEKGFSEEGRDQLLGIASQYDSQTGIDDIEIDSTAFNLTGNGIDNNPNLQLLTDLTLDAKYSEAVVDDKLEKETDLNFEYAVSSRALIRAGYTLANTEWWEKQTVKTESTKTAENEEDENLLNEDVDLLSVNSSESVFREEQDIRRSLGLAYSTSDQLTLSADYIENNEFQAYIGNREYSGNSTVFGLQYNDKMGTIRAMYQLNLSDDVTEQITGVELDFNNLATFSAAYKLLDPEQIESTLSSQTAWDLGIGVNLNEDYGLNLGYEIINDEDDETEAETNISASFEINF
jgi:hypothetical protein